MLPVTNEMVWFAMIHHSSSDVMLGWSLPGEVVLVLVDSSAANIIKYPLSADSSQPQPGTVRMLLLSSPGWAGRTGSWPGNPVCRTTHTALPAPDDQVPPQPCLDQVTRYQVPPQQTALPSVRPARQPAGWAAARGGALPRCSGPHTAGRAK